MKIRYQFFQDHNLLIQKYVGEWSTLHYEEFVDLLLSGNEIKKTEKILTDLREINLKFAIADEEYIKGIRNKIPYTHFNNIHLVENPLSTAIAHLYQEQFVAEGLNYNYCSTMLRAIELLSLKLTVDEMENRLKSLENQY
jgi:deoxyxylulose-5-phosphate synthase